MAIIEGIVANGVTEILKKLIPVIAEEIKLARGVKDELEKLQRSSEMILAVIADAESRQVKEEAVRVWLRWLKDVAYDADDVMDEFAYESLHRDQRGDRLRHKLQDFVSSSHNPPVFAFKMAKKIKNINKRLDEITNDMRRFHLQSAPVYTSMVHGESGEQRSRQTASFINDSQTVGRKDDMIKIVDILTKATKSSSSSSSSSHAAFHDSEKVSVISVVGMGGLGKTTLAQMVFKDELVNKYFDERIWVCVSTDFDVEKVLIKILESIPPHKSDINVSDFDLLVNKVQEKLQGKKFLLVLDDLWNEDNQQWERLKSVLLVGAQGSRILITTRKTQVADVVKGSIPPYKLQKLQEDECWSIIEKRAFSPGGAAKTSSNMISIGKEIAKKCSGLPLAAKFLGSLMHSKNKENDWLLIRETEVWNTQEGQSEIRPILKLSYDNLSPHLKQCFSYCSIFPKGWEIKRETLIHLWMAEGFLDTCNVGNGRSIEDVAVACFESLMWSSFLDAEQKSSLGDILTCKMHDLVHDLAQNVIGEEFAALKVSELNDITSKIRRLQLILGDDVDLSSMIFLKSVRNAKKLRTLFIPIGSKLDPRMFSVNNRLRILHVGRPKTLYPKLHPLSVNLKHLRYLFLDSLDLFGVGNDRAISELYNLETLVLTNSYGVENLLSNIQSLQKLRYLDVSCSSMFRLPDSVTTLSNLQTLDLTNCGLFCIPDSISGLKSLRFLNLSDNPFEKLPFSVITLSNLETLDVSTCKNLKALPESVRGLARLRIFDFKYCPLLEELPEDLGTLTQLRYLSLDGTKIRVLPETCANLNNLEYVDLFHCEVPNYVKNWTKLRRFFSKRGYTLGAGELACLETLVYSVQKKLINESQCNVGIEELSNLNFLESLSIMNLQNVEDPADAERANLKGKQNLGDLCLSWEESSLWNSCHHHREVFGALQPPTGLRSLTIQNFMGEVFPRWMCVPSGLPNLVRLDLYN